MKYLIFGRRKRGKTYLVKKLIKDIQIKNIVWFSKYDFEVPSLSDYEGIENISYIGNYEKGDGSMDFGNIDIKDDTLYVFDDVICSDCTASVTYNFAKKAKNTIIAMQYPCGKKEDIQDFDKIFSFYEPYNGPALKEICKLVEHETDEGLYEELSNLKNNEYKEYIPKRLL